MADQKSVYDARRDVASEYNKWLRDSFGMKLSEQGRDTPRDKMPTIEVEFGRWADGDKRNKPPAWLIHFEKDAKGVWIAKTSETNGFRRLAGGFNARSPLQGVYVRIIPLAREAELVENKRQPFETHPYWEWTLAFVFAGKAKVWASGSSGQTIDFDPVTGHLATDLAGKKVRQKYVSAALFALVPRDEQFSNKISLTYGEASEALTTFVNFDIEEDTVKQGPEGAAGA